MYIFDANVLIDFCNVDRTLLRLISKYLGKTYIAMTTLLKVNDLTFSQCQSIDLTIIEPDTELLLIAANRTSKAVADDDYVCAMLAKEHSLICVTNDKSLRNFCNELCVQPEWGLELVAKLADKHAISRHRALNVTEQLHIISPFHINRDIVQQFKTRLNNETSGESRV